jgi:hypothetical protein
MAMTDEIPILGFNSPTGLSHYDDALSAILAERNANKAYSRSMEPTLSGSVSVDSERSVADDAFQTMIGDAQPILDAEMSVAQPVPIPGRNYYRPLSRSTLLNPHSRLAASRSTTWPQHRKPFVKPESDVETVPCKETLPLMHPHLHGLVPVKKSLIACFLEQGYGLPHSEF